MKTLITILSLSVLFLAGCKSGLYEPDVDIVADINVTNNIVIDTEDNGIDNNDNGIERASIDIVVDPDYCQFGTRYNDTGEFWIELCGKERFIFHFNLDGGVDLSVVFDERHVKRFSDVSVSGYYYGEDVGSGLTDIMAVVYELASGGGVGFKKRERSNPFGVKVVIEGKYRNYEFGVNYMLAHCVYCVEKDGKFVKVDVDSE